MLLTEVIDSSHGRSVLLGTCLFIASICGTGALLFHHQHQLLQQQRLRTPTSSCTLTLSANTGTGTSIDTGSSVPKTGTVASAAATAVAVSKAPCKYKNIVLALHQPSPNDFNVLLRNDEVIDAAIKGMCTLGNSF